MSPGSPPEPFAKVLAGGRPNSLGRAPEVVEAILHEPGRLSELLDVYRLPDELVRLRASSVLKRVHRAHPALVLADVDRVLDEVATLDQPSTRWTSAEVLGALRPDLDDARRRRVVRLLEDYLRDETDWIVLMRSSAALTAWAHHDPALAGTTVELVRPLLQDPRRSVRGAARRCLDDLEGGG